MGIDASIFIRLKPEGELSLPGECWASALDLDKLSPHGATHEIHNTWRLFDKDYARGDWPAMSQLFLQLMADPDVEKIWYSGDCSEWWEAPLFTFEKYMELCKVWLSGERR